VRRRKKEKGIGLRPHGPSPSLGGVGGCREHDGELKKKRSTRKARKSKIRGEEC